MLSVAILRAIIITPPPPLVPLVGRRETVTASCSAVNSTKKQTPVICLLSLALVKYVLFSKGNKLGRVPLIRRQSLIKCCHCCCFPLGVFFVVVDVEGTAILSSLFKKETTDFKSYCGVGENVST